MPSLRMVFLRSSLLSHVAVVYGIFNVITDYCNFIVTAYAPCCGHALDYASVDLYDHIESRICVKERMNALCVAVVLHA